ncbi:hypothetical protein GQ457_06G007610 [Hibiscus cannabinus]
MISDSSPELSATCVNACENSGNAIDESASNIVSPSDIPADFVSNNDGNTNNASVSTLIPSSVGVVHHDDDAMSHAICLHALSFLLFDLVISVGVASMANIGSNLSLQMDTDPGMQFTSGSGEQVFSNKQISVRLDDSNFLLWKQHVILLIWGHALESCLDPAVKAPAKTIVNDAGEHIPNPSYLKFVKQDSSLASWLLFTISASVLPQLVGAETTSAIWNTILKLYSSLSTTIIMHLYCRLRSLKKGVFSMREYTTQVMEICDLLATCGSVVSEVEQIATTLNGLPPEFEHFVVVISASREPYTLEAAISVLIDTETRLQDPMRIPIGINTVQYAKDSYGVVGQSPPSASESACFMSPTFPLQSTRNVTRCPREVSVPATQACLDIDTLNDQATTENLYDQEIKYRSGGSESQVGVEHAITSDVGNEPLGNVESEPMASPHTDNMSPTT